MRVPAVPWAGSLAIIAMLLLVPQWCEVENRFNLRDESIVMNQFEEVPLSRRSVPEFLRRCLYLHGADFNVSGMVAHCADRGISMDKRNHGR